MGQRMLIATRAATLASAISITLGLRIDCIISPLLPMDSLEQVMALCAVENALHIQLADDFIIEEMSPSDIAAATLPQ